MFYQLRNSLRRQLVLLIGALAMASALGYVLLTSWLVEDQIEQDQLELQTLLANRMAAQMAQDMAARASELRFLASMDRLRDPERAAADKQAMLMAKKAVYPVYAWIGVTDADGRILASTEPRLAGADVSRRAWFLGGRKGLHFEDIHDAVLLGKLLPRPQRDELPLRLIDVALPLQDQQGRFVGVLAAHLSLDWTYELRNNLLDQLDDPAMEMLLVNRAGDVIVGNPDLPANEANLASLNVVRLAQAGRVGTGIETWPDGRHYLSVAVPALGSAPYPGLGWAVLVRQNEALAFADARRLGWLTLAVGLASTLLFSSVLWWAAGRKLRPMEELSHAVQRIDPARPQFVLPEFEGDDEVAVYARSMARVLNALGDSRERFQHLFDHAPVAMAFVSLQGDVLLINARFTAMLGYDRRHLSHIHQWFSQAFPEGAARDDAIARWALAQQYTGRSPRALPAGEYDVRRFDGSSCTVEASGIALPDGLLVSFHDLTERRQAETGLRLWAEAFERSEVGLLIADVKTNTVVAANPAFSRQRGYGPQALAGMPIPCLYPERAVPGLQAALSAVHQQDHVVFETEHITRDGHIFPVLVDVTVLRDTQGVPVRRVAYVQDLTERERAAQEIRRLNAELERRVVERTAELSAANRELNSFAYTVSHDLRAPLRTINGFAQLLCADFAEQLGAEGAEHLQRIQSGTRRMGELIEGLLALSRHTNKPLERVPVNLSAIATRRLAELAAAEPTRRVDTQVEPDLVADCDAALAEALLVNLLDNAWKYSAKTAQAQIRFGPGEVDGLRGFCVSDNGAGFDMAQAGRLFEPFERLHHPSDFQGTGVGLTTVHRIVDRHGGRITVQAAPGQGACFCFTLRPEA